MVVAYVLEGVLFELRFPSLFFPMKAGGEGYTLDILSQRASPTPCFADHCSHYTVYNALYTVPHTT